jgi:multidrug transporter EmrE-like cation transporter
MIGQPMKIFLYTIPVALLVAYSQLVVKWRISTDMNSVIVTNTLNKFIGYFSDPYILSAYVAALLSSFIWLVVIQRIPLSTGFPVYMGSTFLLVILGSWILLGESISPMRLLAATLILAGIILGSVN